MVEKRLFIGLLATRVVAVGRGACHLLNEHKPKLISIVEEEHRWYKTRASLAAVDKAFKLFKYSVALSSYTGSNCSLNNSLSLLVLKKTC